MASERCRRGSTLLMYGSTDDTQSVPWMTHGPCRVQQTRTVLGRTTHNEEESTFPLGIFSVSTLLRPDPDLERLRPKLGSFVRRHGMWHRRDGSGSMSEAPRSQEYRSTFTDLGTHT